MEEIDLINSAIQNGDDEGWRHIYNRYYGAVKQTLFRCGFQGQDAEDLVHQTFIKIFKTNTKLHFNNMRAFYAWLIRVTKNVVYDLNKSKAFRDEKQTEYHEDMDELKIEIPKEIESNGSINNKINDALKKLSDKEQKLLVMRADNTSYERISVETGIPLNGIRMYYKRAKEKLRKCLSDGGLTI